MLFIYLDPTKHTDPTSILRWLGCPSCDCQLHQSVDVCTQESALSYFANRQFHEIIEGFPRSKTPT